MGCSASATNRYRNNNQYLGWVAKLDTNGETYWEDDETGARTELGVSEPDSKPVRIAAAGRRYWTMVAAQSQIAFRSVQHSGSVIALAWSPNSLFVATCCDDSRLRIVSAESWQTLHTVPHPAQLVNSLAWSPNSDEVVTGCADGHLRIVSTETGKVVLLIDRPKAENKGKTKNSVTCVAWRPKSALVSGLATGVVAAGFQDSNLRIFATRNGVSMGQKAHPGRLAAVTFSPAGSEVASACDDGKVRILDCLSGVMLREFEHNAPLSCMSWSPLGTELALSDVNGKLWVQDSMSFLGRGNWDAMPPPKELVPVRTAVARGDSPDDDSDEGEDMLPMPVPLPPKVETGKVCSIAWSSDGAELGIGTSDGSVQIVNYHKYMTRRVILPDGTKRRLYPDEVVRELCPALSDTQDARCKFGQVVAVSWSPEVLSAPNEKTFKI